MDGRGAMGSSPVLLAFADSGIVRPWKRVFLTSSRFGTHRARSGRAAGRPRQRSRRRSRPFSPSRRDPAAGFEEAGATVRIRVRGTEGTQVRSGGQAGRGSGAAGVGLPASGRGGRASTDLQRGGGKARGRGSRAPHGRVKRKRLVPRASRTPPRSMRSILQPATVSPGPRSLPLR